MGTQQEIGAFEPVIRQAGMTPLPHVIDPHTLDVETIVLDEELAERIEAAALAIVIADVIGDDRLPLISFVDESLPEDNLLLASCTQAGATEQAAICQHRHRVGGIGVLGVLSGRQVIEVAGGLTTAEAMVSRAVTLLENGGLSAFVVQDSPGLVIARTLIPIVNEAAFAITEGLASAEDIDRAMTLGANFPFGPLHWADEIGIDRVLLAMEYLVQSTYEERYRPAPLLRRMAQAGFIGRSSGQGFFAYSDSEND